MEYLKSIFSIRFPASFLQFGLLIGMLIPGQLAAQLDAYKFGDIISAGNVKVELWLVKPKNTCGSNAREWKFKLKTQGVATIKSTQRYVTWELITVNCENNDRILRVFSIDLKSMRFENGVSVGSTDWGFTAQAIERGILNARLQSTDNTKKDINLSQQDKGSLVDDNPQNIDHSTPPTDAKYFGDIINQAGMHAELWALEPQSRCDTILGYWKYWLRLRANNMPANNSAMRYLTWKLNMATCDNYVVQKVFSVDLANLSNDTTLQRRLGWTFQADSIVGKIQDARFRVSETLEKDKKLGPNITLAPLDSVVVSREISRGKATTLRILGKPLPANARWVWYTNPCGEGTPAHVGAELTILPTETITYWVRSELEYTVSECRQVQVVQRKSNIKPVAKIEDGVNRIYLGSTNEAYTTAIGVRISAPVSVSAKHFISANTAIEGILGSQAFSAYSWVSLGAALQKHKRIQEITDLSIGSLQLYYGAGASILFWEFDFNTDASTITFGLQGYLGLDYKVNIKKVPVSVTVDWIPSVSINGYTSGISKGYALSVRYILQ